jgi:hypothetical protein
MSAVLDRRLDDLLLRARGLALVRELLARRGASRAELDAHTRELERVEQKLAAALVEGPTSAALRLAAAPQPARQLAEDDHAEEDQAHHEHPEDDVRALTGCVQDHGATLAE